MIPAPVLAFFPAAADRRLLREGRLSGPMPWVLAIMLFLTMLAAAGGVALGGAARAIGGGLADRATIQIVQADPVRREAEAGAMLTALRREPGVAAVDRVASGEIATLLEPWLGSAGVADLPLPVLIDVRLAGAGTDRLAVLARRIAPDARVDDHRAALAPVARLIATLRWLALAVVLSMMVATACTVMLAAAAALDLHRGTIDVMHLLGATDGQIALLFQRRIAIDVLFAGAIALAGAVAVVILIGRRMAALGSDLVGSVALSPGGWTLVVLLPIAATGLAMATARWTVLRALRRPL